MTAAACVHCGRGPAPAALTLTERERQILARVAAGQTGRETAEDLGLAENTVAQHLASVRRKYGVHTSLAAVQAARLAGELPAEGIPS